MQTDLNNLWNEIKKAKGDEQRKLFVNFCDGLIGLKEEGLLSEEEVANKIVSAMMEFNDLNNYPECEVIFESAATAELPRDISYAQSMGKWDKKTADHIKQKEWEELVAAVKYAKNKQ